jgi:hypothetical protein
MKAQFKVQHEILAGLKYLQKGVTHGSEQQDAGDGGECHHVRVMKRICLRYSGLIWSEHRREARV